MRTASRNTRGEKRWHGALGAIVLALAALAARPAAAQLFTGPIVLHASSGAATDTLPIVVDLQPPNVTITSPLYNSVIAGTTVTVTGTVTDAEDGAGTGAPRPVFAQLLWVATDNAGLRLGNGSVPVVAGRFTIPNVALGTGPSAIEVTAVDEAGNVGGGSTLVTSDPNAPPVAVVSPLPGSATLDPSTSVDLDFAARTTLVSVNGVADGRTFSAGIAQGILNVPLQVGANVVSLAFDSGAGPHSFDFTLFRVASIDPIRIATPADGTLTNKSPATVTVIAPLGTPFVQVNGIAATVSPDGTTFKAQVPLYPGANNLQALAAPFGQQATAHVTLDAIPPQITLVSPSNGASVDPNVLVAGFVSKNATVKVSGPGGSAQAALRFDAARSVQLFQPSFGSFSSMATEITVYDFDVPNYPLVVGSNTLTIQAVDAAGNMGSTTVTVFQQGSALQLVAPADGSTLAAAQTDVTLQALADSVIDAVYVAGRRLPAFDGRAVAAGTVILPGLPLVPGSDDIRIVSHRVSGTGQELLEFTLVSTTTNVATVSGTVTDAASGAPIDGASVTVTEGSNTFVVVTNPDGTFSTSVVPGPITIAGTATGEGTASVSVTPSVGQTATANLALPSAGIPGLPNQLAVIVPPPNTVTDWDLITVVGTVESPASSVTVNGIAAQVVGNRFTAQHVPLTMGANTLTATATTPGAAAATAAVTVQRSNTPTLNAKIYSPPNGATIPGAGLVLRGWVSAKSALTLVGDGLVPAAEGSFVLDDYAPLPGNPPIQLLSQTADGTQTASDQISVKFQSSNPAITLTAQPAQGPPPLTTTLTPRFASAFQLAALNFDVLADGTLTPPDAGTTSKSLTFTDPRPYEPRVFVTTPDGVELTAATRVLVRLAPVVLQQFAPGNPVDLVSDPRGRICVLDGAAAQVSCFAADGTLGVRFGSSGGGPGQLQGPQGFDIAPDGRFYVADTGNDRIQVFRPDGSFDHSLGQSGNQIGALRGPRAVAVDGNSVVVADSGNARIERLALNGSSAAAFPFPDARAVAAVGGYGVIATSPQQGALSLVGTKTASLPQLALLPAEAQIAAPVDVAEGSVGILFADASRSAVIVLRPDLSLDRVVDGLPVPPLAVASGTRPDMPSIFVADGTKVTELGLPVDSPIPALTALQARLAAGDISGALGFVSPYRRDYFTTLYQYIQADLPSEAAAMSDVSVSYLRENLATLVLRRTENVNGTPVVRLYPVSMVRSEDGRWLVYDY